MYLTRGTMRLVVSGLAVSALVIGGCGPKQADEKLAERASEEMLEHATGSDAKVDLNGKDLKITTADGSVEMTETAEWPADMFETVPRLTSGTIERVTRATEEGTRKFNLWYREVPDEASAQYEATLKAAGFETQLMAMGPQSNMLSGQKGSLAVQLMHSREERSAILIVFEVADQ